MTDLNKLSDPKVREAILLAEVAQQVAAQYQKGGSDE